MTPAKEIVDSIVREQNTEHLKKQAYHLLVLKYKIAVEKQYNWSSDYMDSVFPYIESAANGTNQNIFDCLKYTEQIEMYKNLFQRRSPEYLNRC